MASWKDGAKYAPLTPPNGFAHPNDRAIEFATTVAPASIPTNQPINSAPDSFKAPASPDLAKIAAKQVDKRNPLLRFETTSETLPNQPADPKQPIVLNNTPTSYQIGQPSWVNHSNSAYQTSWGQSVNQIGRAGVGQNIPASYPALLTPDAQQANPHSENLSQVKPESSEDRIIFAAVALGSLTKIFTIFSWLNWLCWPILFQTVWLSSKNKSGNKLILPATLVSIGVLVAKMFIDPGKYFTSFSVLLHYSSKDASVACLFLFAIQSLWIYTHQNR